MNNRPRQTLQWRTPAEKLNEFLTSTDATTP
jgi:IS30 family transposase